MLRSTRTRTMPSAARRRPNGSRLPLGFLPIENTPASVSSLSDSATALIDVVFTLITTAGEDERRIGDLVQVPADPPRPDQVPLELSIGGGVGEVGEGTVHLPQQPAETLQQLRRVRSSLGEDAARPHRIKYKPLQRS